MAEISTTRAVVLTAAFAHQMHRCFLLLDEEQISERLEGELKAPTFRGMSDRDLAELMQGLEIELHKRGWRPERAWRKVPSD